MNPQNGHFTLLIVDDDKHNRLLLTELFEGEYKIIQAKNGLQALELARAHAPELILLDVLMPDPYPIARAPLSMVTVFTDAACKGKCKTCDECWK